MWLYAIILEYVAPFMYVCLIRDDPNANAHRFPRLITSPITSYADQIYSIHRTRSSAGFSLDIPLIMLVASILK